jgi:hypothetical protein
MKILTLILGIIVLLLASCEWCPAQVMAEDSTYFYADLRTDSTAWVQIGSGPKILSMRFKDSVNVKILFDYKMSNADSVYKTYSLQGDSTNSTAPAGIFLSWILRSGYENNIPGANYGRLRVIPKSTKNGKTTPQYNAMMKEY